MIQRVLVLWFAFTSAAYSQSKVGTTGAQFLELPLSARSAGMGDIGTVLMDGHSYHTNPATLGFFQPGRVSVQLDPLVSGYYGTEVHVSSMSAASKIRDGKTGGPTIGVGVRIFQLSSGPMIERTYNRGVDYPDEGIFGTGRTFAWNDTKAGFAVGLGWSGKIDFGVGAGLNYIRENVHDYHAETWTSDMGAHLGFAFQSDDGAAFGPPRIIIGASLCNVGPDIKFIEKEAPLPLTGRVGVGCELTWRRDGRSLLQLFPAVQYERHYSHSHFNTITRYSHVDTWKQGIEIRLREIVSARVGYISPEGYEKSQWTYGFGLSTVGLHGAPPAETSDGGGFFSSVSEHVDVQLSFAHHSSIIDEWDGTNYYGIELLF